MRPVHAFLLAGMLALMAGQPAAQEGPARLTVAGEGRAAAAPDMATITLGVVAEAQTADAAVAAMSERSATLLARLSQAGLEPRDVQTSGLRLNPRRRQPEQGQSGPGVIEGFVAATDVTVRVRALDELGPILDATVKAGANTFGGLIFGLSEPQPVLDAARQEAVADARRKAALYAEAAGVSLGRLLALNEAEAGRPPVMRAELARADVRGVPVAEGELEMRAQVTLVYAIE